MTHRKPTAVAIAGICLAVAAQVACAQAAQSTPAREAAPLRAEPSRTNADAVFAAWDADHNGALSLQEFRDGSRGMRRTAGIRGRLHGQFEAVDANGNDAIDAAEYGKLLLVEKAGKGAPPLSMFDANKDQRLQFPEYLALVRHMTERRTAAPAPAAATAAKR
jgi:hypothetical protein